MQCNHGVFEILIPTDQNRALPIRKFFIIFDINQSESSFHSKWSFQNFDINQSERNVHIF